MKKAEEVEFIMRKVHVVFLSILLIVAGWAATNILCDVSSAEYSISDSKLFQREEIEDAMDVLKRASIIKKCGFELNTLTYNEEVHYDEISDLDRWRDVFGHRYPIEKVIIIEGTFTVKNAKINTFLQSVFWGYQVNPSYYNGEQVENQWIMFRNEEGHWFEPNLI